VDVFDVRAVTRQDCRDLWVWRNHPEERKWSFNTGNLEYKEHKRWFEQRLKGRKAGMYIAEGKDGEKIGQARFDLSSKGFAYISMNLNPNFIGKGLGSKVIKRATDTFLKEEPKVKAVVSEIIKENIGSIKAFQKAGYTFSNNSLKNGKQIAVSIFRRPE